MPLTTEERIFLVEFVFYEGDKYTVRAQERFKEFPHTKVSHRDTVRDLNKIKKIKKLVLFYCDTNSVYLVKLLMHGYELMAKLEVFLLLLFHAFVHMSSCSLCWFVVCQTTGGTAQLSPTILPLNVNGGILLDVLLNAQ